MFFVLGYWSKEEFEDKSRTHFITYFERQDESFLKCGLYAVNNACNRMIFTENNMIKVAEDIKENMKQNIFSKSTFNIITDSLYDRSSGHFNMDVLTVTMNNFFACNTLQRLKPLTQLDVDPVRYIVCCEDNDMNHCIAICQVQCFKWLFKDLLGKRPLLVNNFLMQTLLKHWSRKNTKNHVYYLDNSKVQDKTKELNYDMLEWLVDKSSIND
eukprot:12300567-Ditylum_brightwellii.AAC.1